MLILGIRTICAGNIFATFYLLTDNYDSCIFFFSLDCETFIV